LIFWRQAKDEWLKREDIVRRQAIFLFFEL
jgi:hypothetical protein